MAVRIRLGGNTDVAKNLLPTGRKLLVALAEGMRFSDLKQDQRTMRMADGTVIKVKRVFGQDTIEVTVPVVGVPEEEVKKEVPINLEYRVKIINKTTNQAICVDQLSRLAFYTKDATSLSDSEEIVFDYTVPVDTDPEIYFGSEDNPGVTWSDSDECFVVDIFLFTDAGIPAEAFSLAAAGLLKYYMVYSCVGNIENIDEFETINVNHQFENITEGVDRWKEEDLIPPNIFADDNTFFDYYEDSMRCNRESFILVKMGDYVTAFDAIGKCLAKGVLNNDGDIIEWPELYSNISTWLSQLSAGSAVVTKGGTLSDCSDLDIPSCTPSGSDSVATIDRDTTDTYDCSYSLDENDNRAIIESENIIRIYSYVEGGCNIVIANSFITYSEYLTHNSERVVMANEIASDEDFYQLRKKVPPYDGDENYDVYRTSTIWTPWGTCFTAFPSYVENIIGNQTSLYGWNYSSSELYKVYPPHRNVKIARAVGDNVIFYFAGGWAQLRRYWAMNSSRNYTQYAFDSIHYDAVGCIGYFTDDEYDDVDVTALNSTEDIKHGLSALYQAYCEDYYETNGFYPSGTWSTELNITHKNWSV